jgi:hypothetical protein
LTTGSDAEAGAVGTSRTAAVISAQRTVLNFFIVHSWGSDLFLGGGFGTSTTTPCAPRRITGFDV